MCPTCGRKGRDNREKVFLVLFFFVFVFVVLLYQGTSLFLFFVRGFVYCMFFFVCVFLRLSMFSFCLLWTSMFFHVSVFGVYPWLYLCFCVFVHESWF